MPTDCAIWAWRSRTSIVVLRVPAKNAEVAASAEPEVPNRQMSSTWLVALALKCRQKRVLPEALLERRHVAAQLLEHEEVPRGETLPALEQVALPLLVVFVVFELLCAKKWLVESSPMADTPSLSLQMPSPSVKTDILALLLHLPLPLAIGRGPHRLPLVARH